MVFGLVSNIYVVCTSVNHQQVFDSRVQKCLVFLFFTKSAVQLTIHNLHMYFTVGRMHSFLFVVAEVGAKYVHIFMYNAQIT